MAAYLGLDSSTQSLSCIIVDTDEGRVVAEESVNFGEALPHYHCPHGFLPSDDPRIKHSDPLMWVEALDLLLAKVKRSGVDFEAIRGISGAGQQHGSVYLSRRLAEAGPFRSESHLVEQVQPLLARRTSPIWMDSSTSRECRELSDAIGGDERMVELTGSRAIERFTAAQIRRFAKNDPEGWARTREVHLVSSFMASLLVADSVPIDYGDAAGMNLLELRTGRWHAELLEATAPGLSERLLPPVASATEVGRLGDYFVEKYGFSTNTPVFAFTGDNPSSLVGMGASRPGTAVVSLGTSDTVFAAMAEPRTDPRGYGHVFGNPAGGFMSLICFANGSLARERIAEQYGLDWPAFARAIVADSRPGNGGNGMLPYFIPEMTPKVLRPSARAFGSQDFIAGRNPAAAARAIVEAQALSMRLHSDWIGQRPSRIRVTGGASRNPGILRILADVFQAEIVPLTVANSSALGGALRAAQATEGVAWEQLFSQFAAPEAALAVAPDPEAVAAYEELSARFETELETLLGARA